MVTKQMYLKEILDMDDRVAAILRSYGLDCGSCSGVHSETLEEAAKGHGVALEDLIKALNEVVKD